MRRDWSVSARRVSLARRASAAPGISLRSTYYADQARQLRPKRVDRRGRPSHLSDEAMLERIREVLRQAKALGIRGEGYESMTARSSRQTPIGCGDRRQTVATRLEGTATVFMALDHFVGDVVGIHAARLGTRFEALEPIYRGYVKT